MPTDRTDDLDWLIAIAEEAERTAGAPGAGPAAVARRAEPPGAPGRAAAPRPQAGGAEPRAATGLEPGWLSEAFARVHADTMRWPTWMRQTAGLRGDYPEVVCVCGAPHAGAALRAVERAETLAGRIVLMPLLPKPGAPAPDATTAARLEALQARKIDLADAVLVVDGGGEIDAPTARAIAYAGQIARPIRWLEPRRVGGDDPPATLA